MNLYTLHMSPFSRPGSNASAWVRCVSLLFSCAAACALTGCLPNRFVIDLAGSDGVLKEKVVLSDAKANAASAKVALIDVEGLLAHTPAGGLIAGRGTAVDDLVARLEKAEQDPNVKAVLLRINSPGGTVAASESMYREIAGFRERTRKPVVVSIAEVAASGGYYISLASDRIIAQPSSITGSIGVIIQTVNFSKGMSMIGVEARAVKSGPMKDLANPLEPIREEQYAVLQGTVNDFYDSFTALVRERRPAIDSARFADVTDGRVFTGRQALDAALVDALGGLREAFSEAKKLAGLESARMVKYHPEGRTPASPYALASSSELHAHQDAGIMHLLPDSMLLPPGFYYLWSVEVP